MACAPFNRNLVCGGHVIQGDAADASVESRVPQETLRRYALPVDTLTVRSFWQVTSETCTAPVVTVRFSASAEVCSARMSPVVVWMLAAPETAAQKTTFPVLEVISARSNVNASAARWLRCFR